MEVSAKEDINVEPLFKQLSRSILNVLRAQMEEETVPDDCYFRVNVDISAPINVNSDQESGVTGVTVVDLNRVDFEYDVTWVTRHFHDLDRIWFAQRSFLDDKFRFLFTLAVDEALRLNPPREWVQRKMQQLREKVRIAQQIDSSRNRTQVTFPALVQQEEE